MNRVAVFAHFDKNGKIEDYVIYYLEGLKKVANKIIFVSDSDIPNIELEKIKNIVDYSIIGKHGEYDFGSYKRGYLFAKEQGWLENTEELIFANDSCYAPLYPFDEMFDEMSPKNIDFWGATKNHYGYCSVNNTAVAKYRDHIQSYFIVFKESIFNSDIFKDFINSICKKNSKLEIISEYEIGLTELLTKNGYRWDVYSKISKDNTINNPSILKYKQIIKKEHCPFLKRNLVLYKEYKAIYPTGIKPLIDKFTNYDYNLINTDKKHNSLNLPLITKILGILKTYRQELIRLHFREKELIIMGKSMRFKTKDPMKNKNIKILVCYHKKDTLYKNEILVPMHCGRSVAMENSKDGKISEENYNWCMENLIGDNTGENISDLNRQFCELSAIYWAYKNYDKLGNPDYIGLLHYRTFFDLSKFSKKYMVEKMYTNDVLNKLLDKYDGVISSPLNSLKDFDKEWYYETVNDEHLHLSDDNYPKLNTGFRQYLKDRNVHYKNMFILKKEDFFEMCDELFSLLISIYNNKKNELHPRECGYISEILTSFFFNYLKTKNRNFYCAKWLDVPLNRKNNFIENIFSVRNECHRDIKRKIITVFGLKIKIRCKNPVYSK